MSHHPSRGAPIWAMPSDLESGAGLVNLIGAAARALGRDITMPADHADLDVARQLLELLGLVDEPRCPGCGEPQRLIASGAVGHVPGSRCDVLARIAAMSEQQAGDVLRRFVRDEQPAGVR